LNESKQTGEQGDVKEVKRSRREGHVKESKIFWRILMLLCEGLDVTRRGEEGVQKGRRYQATEDGLLALIEGNICSKNTQRAE